MASRKSPACPRAPAGPTSSGSSPGECASERDAKKLTEFEKKTGWKYQATATNITTGLGKIAGTRQAQWIDTVHRNHAVVEDRVRTNKCPRLCTLAANPAVSAPPATGATGPDCERKVSTTHPGARRPRAKP